jgi:hypothetical protein
LRDLGRFALFSLFAATLVAAVHVYLWRRLVRAVGLPPPWQRRAGAALAALGILAAFAAIRPIWVDARVTSALCVVGFPWLAVSSLTAAALALTELPRWLLRSSTGPAGADAGRRHTLERLCGGAAAAAGVGTAIAGAREATDLVIERVRVPLRRLPPELSGLRIVQISDLHFGAAVGPDYLDRVFAEVTALAPDLVAITGDLIDGDVADLRRPLQRLHRLPTRYGVFFVTGNHEYYWNAGSWIPFLVALGVRVLRNERVSIGAPGASFDLAGVDDLSAAAWGKGFGHDLPRALEGRDPTRELVLLAHQPASIHEAARHGVGLQLSGHTHGGQIWPVRLLLHFTQPFIDGLHRVQDTWIYVSRGTGYWGPTLRLGARPEITEITLVTG